MYAKLIVRNAKRSGRDYLIYLITMTLCVTLFYAFLSITSKSYSPGLGEGYDLMFLNTGMKIAICAISLLLLFLIQYVNKYMLQSRQKEFAVQAVIGMEKKPLHGCFLALAFGQSQFGIFKPFKK